MAKSFILSIIIALAAISGYYVLSSVHKEQKKVAINLEDKIHKTNKLLCEYGYFEGQKDAISGDIRVVKSDSGKFQWSKSPWDEDTSKDFASKVYDPNKSIVKQHEEVLNQ